MKNVIIIIPARIGSTRLPGKPLKILQNKPLIYWTWKNCSKAINHNQIYVATDSKKITNCCKKYNINSIMTSSKCLTGTDRVSEAAKKFKNKVIINLQGDEPFINYKDIKKFIKFTLKYKNYVTNAYAEIIKKKKFKSINIPKVIIKKNNDLLYMSRAPIPGSKNKNFFQAKKQICMYGFPVKILQKYFGEKKIKTPLEKLEDIEILRLVENNICVKMIKVNDNKISIDTKEDLLKAQKIKI